MRKFLLEKGEGEIAVTKKVRVSTHRIRIIAVLLMILVAIIAVISFYIRNDRKRR